jgi:microcystin-dependent protein
MTITSAIQPTIAPNLPAPSPTFSQDYLNQLTNALRLYFGQIDNFTKSASTLQYGNTASRPALNLNVGQMYFDTDLGLPIFWNGSAWETAVGTGSASPVLSFSGGSTGLTPATPTTGAVTLAGTLGIANGGTGLTSVGSSGTVLTSNGSVASWQAPATISGAIQMWPTTTAPAGYLLCNGGSYSTTTYAALFAVVGYTFGGSGGSFNVPNYTDRMPIGAGNAYGINAQGGSANATLVAHSHGININDPGHQHLFGADDQISPAGGYNVQSGFSYDAASTLSGGGVNLYTKRTDNTNNPQTTGITASSDTQGGSATNANLPPYLGINFIIKT